MTHENEGLTGVSTSWEPTVYTSEHPRLMFFHRGKQFRFEGGRFASANEEEEKFLQPCFENLINTGKARVLDLEAGVAVVEAHKQVLQKTAAAKGTFTTASLSQLLSEVQIAAFREDMFTRGIDPDSDDATKMLAELGIMHVEDVKTYLGERTTKEETTETVEKTQPNSVVSQLLKK